MRHEADRVLSQEERAVQKDRLDALANLRDEDINYSDIPPITDFSERVYGPWTEREPYTVTLRLDAEVIAWLEAEGKKQGYLINLLLKREAQRARRARAKQGLAMDQAS